jgi:hypothetical protein
MPDPNETQPDAGAAPREELDGTEGGLWVVSTRDSKYLFDLDQHTVTRMPGAGAASTINDQTRPLREIVQCRIGEPGLWTMQPDSPWSDVRYYWSVSSAIARIEPLPADFPVGPSDQSSDCAAFDPAGPQQQQEADFGEAT